MINTQPPSETNVSPLDETVANLALGDPPNTSIPLTGRSLCQNVLAVGMVGSGKTTSVIYPILRDAIACRAGEDDRKIGLFVFDSKCDGTTERVEAWATRHGRADDVIVLRPGSDWGIDPIGQESQLSQLEVVSAQLACLLHSMGGDNAYWEQTADGGIKAALAYDMLHHGQLDWVRTLRTLETLLLRCGPNEPAQEMVNDFVSHCSRVQAHIDPHAGRILDSYASTLKSWVKLDPKTLGILKTCVGNALQPLLSPQILGYYPIEGRRAFDISRIVREGKILVLQVNANADASMAATLGRLVKAAIYRALQQRAPQAGSDERLVGLFFDEYPLVATSNEPYFGDVLNLQTLREKRGFVVAGTQGYVSMQQAIGARAWEALRINFGTTFFLKSNERDVEAHARAILGDKDGRSSVRFDIESRDAAAGGVVTASQSHRRVSVEGEEPIIAQGALARLQAHEMFYATSDGQIGEEPVFVLPVFEEYRNAQSAATGRDNPVDVAAATFRYLRRMEAESDEGEDDLIEGFIAPAPGLPSNYAHENEVPPMPCGTWGALHLVTVDRIFRETMAHGTAEAGRRTKRNARQAGLTFAHLALDAHLWHDEVTPEIKSILQRARRAVLDFYGRFQASPTQQELNAASRELYKALGLRTELKDVTDPAAALAGRDHLKLCRRITKLNLGSIPEEFYGEGSVGFFTALEHPSHRAILPRLASVSGNDRLPLAIFDPTAVNEENALTIAAAMVCFANSMTPSQVPTPRESVVCTEKW
jgi:hypothetical protein